MQKKPYAFMLLIFLHSMHTQTAENDKSKNYQIISYIQKYVLRKPSSFHSFNLDLEEQLFHYIRRLLTRPAQQPSRPPEEPLHCQNGPQSGSRK